MLAAFLLLFVNASPAIISNHQSEVLPPELEDDELDALLLEDELELEVELLLLLVEDEDDDEELELELEPESLVVLINTPPRVPLSVTVVTLISKLPSLTLAITSGKVRAVLAPVSSYKSKLLKTDCPSTLKLNTRAAELEWYSSARCNCTE